jgi:hypothetical protein
MKQTRQAVRAIKQSIFLDVYDFYILTWLAKVLSSPALIIPGKDFSNSFWSQYYKTFLGIIYATSSIFPYDFDLGYDDSDAIMSKKCYNIGQWST